MKRKNVEMQKTHHWMGFEKDQTNTMGVMSQIVLGLDNGLVDILKSRQSVFLYFAGILSVTEDQSLKCCTKRVVLMGGQIEQNLRGENSLQQCHISSSTPGIHFIVKLAEKPELIILLFIFLSSKTNERKDNFSAHFFSRQQIETVTTTHVSEMNFSMSSIVQMFQTL